MTVNIDSLVTEGCIIEFRPQMQSDIDISVPLTVELSYFDRYGRRISGVPEFRLNFPEKIKFETISDMIRSNNEGTNVAFLGLAPAGSNSISVKIENEGILFSIAVIVDPSVSTSFSDFALNQINQLKSKSPHLNYWDNVLEDEIVVSGDDDYQRRLELHHRNLGVNIHAGFIGSNRLKERFEIFLKTQDLSKGNWQEQIEVSKFDFIIIESSRLNDIGGWTLLFDEDDGSDRTDLVVFIDFCRRQQLKVVLYANQEETDIAHNDKVRRLIDSVIVEQSSFSKLESESEIYGLPKSGSYIACTPFQELSCRDLSIIVPVGSDIFHDPNFAEFLQGGLGYDTLVSEANFSFIAHAAAARIPKNDFTWFGESSRGQDRVLLRSADIAIVTSNTIRSTQQLNEILIDCLGSGTLPVVFGKNNIDTDLTDFVTIVNSREKFEIFMRNCRSDWFRDNLVKRGLRHFRRQYSWDQETLNKNLLSPLFIDEPKGNLDRSITMVTVTKRENLIPRIVENFRKQSHREKKLCIIVNTGPHDKFSFEDQLDKKRESIFFVNSYYPIGACLNLAIKNVDTQYWAKMDDDDIYSKQYLSDLVEYYESSMADVIGRRAAFYFFKRQNLIKQNISSMNQAFRRPRSDYVHSSGATLSGRKSAKVPQFSNRMRNSVDSNWVELLYSTNLRYVLGDISDMVVFRDDLSGDHTWKPSQDFLNKMSSIFTCNLEDFSELTEYE